MLAARSLRSIVILATVTSVTMPAHGATPKARNRAKSEEPIPPAIRAAMIKAYEANKPLLIDVGAVW